MFAQRRLPYGQIRFDRRWRDREGVKSNLRAFMTNDSTLRRVSRKENRVSDPLGPAVSSLHFSNPLSSHAAHERASHRVYYSS